MRSCCRFCHVEHDLDDAISAVDHWISDDDGCGGLAVTFEQPHPRKCSEN